MGHLIWLSPTEQAKGNSGKEPKNFIKWPDGVLKLHQMTQWREKNLGRTQAQSGASSPLALWTRDQIYSNCKIKKFIWMPG